jgi:hypothetical protein
MTPQPLAVMTIASAPFSTCGHQASRERPRLVVLGQVIRQRAAAAAAVDGDRGDARAIEHARRGGVDVRRKRRLHASLRDDHFARMPRRGPRARFARLRNRRRERARQERAGESPEPQSDAEQRFGEQSPAQTRTRRRLERRAADAIVDELAPDVDEASVAHARRAGRLAASAGEAAVEMELRARAHLAAFERMLDQVDAPAGPVELVTEQLVRRACCRAESAVHARAQDRVRLATFGRREERGHQLRFHLRLLERYSSMRFGTRRRAQRVVTAPRTCGRG